jgi:predicted signal transduction protein with EAL and GGDEF domain
VTASVGVATFPIHAASRDTLVVAADRALYSSKNSGRNRVSLPPEESCEILITSLADSKPQIDLIDALQRL